MIMKTKQTIAIVGAAGRMGTAIAKALAKGPDRLLLCTSDEGQGRKLAKAITEACPAADVEAAGCATNASWEADIILLAVPYSAEKAIAAQIREVANQKIVVSISNPLNEARYGLLTPPGSSAAEELQDLLPHSKIVKAFNTGFAAAFDRPVIDSRQVDSFICGNDPEALERVAALVRTAGLNPVVAGPLALSRTTEGLALLLIQLTVRHGYNGRAGWKVLHD
jgi:NADPH-dependent F420 reductase